MAVRHFAATQGKQSKRLFSAIKPVPECKQPNATKRRASLKSKETRRITTSRNWKPIVHVSETRPRSDRRHSVSQSKVNRVILESVCSAY